jgi:hypothetical protein
VKRILSAVAAAALGLGLLAACAPQAPAPQPTAAPAKTEPAPTAAAQPGPAATAAPAAAAPKPVEAAKPTAAAPAAKAEPKLGAQLVGTLEGPTIITDPAQVPKSFKEAPQLAELVKQVSEGTLQLMPEVHPLREGPAAFTRVATGRASGRKLLLIP